MVVRCGGEWFPVVVCVGSEWVCRSLVSFGVGLVGVLSGGVCVVVGGLCWVVCCHCARVPPRYIYGQRQYSLW